MRKLAILVALVAVFAMTNAAWSASVNLTLTINTVAKTWVITATDATGANNYGIASFTILLNSISTVQNDSPLLNLTAPSGKYYGFGMTRSGTIPTNNINAFQATTDSGYTVADMKFGVGQVAIDLSSLLKEGEVAGAGIQSTTISNVVRLASGTYTGSTPSWNGAGVNVFKTNGTSKATTSTSVSTIIVRIPEPATLALLSVGGALLGLRRRRTA